MQIIAEAWIAEITIVSYNTGVVAGEVNRRYDAGRDVNVHAVQGTAIEVHCNCTTIQFYMLGTIKYNANLKLEFRKNGKISKKIIFKTRLGTNYNLINCDAVNELLSVVTLMP